MLPATGKGSTVRSLQLIVGGAGALVLLGGCGGGFADGSVDDITQAASEDMKTLKSVRMKGDITSDGQAITMDMQITTDGDCTGSIDMMGGTAEFLSIDGVAWFKPDEAFWQASAPDQADQITAVVGDKWVVLPPEETDLSSFCDLDELLKEFDDDAKNDKDITKGDTEEIDGEEALIINGESDDGEKMKAWVAVDGEHYILKLEVLEGDKGTVEFSDFDEELDLEAPPEDEVIDFSQANG
jgi:hypothetical protein